MRFYWLRDQAITKNFQFFLDSSKHNLACYFTKLYPIKRHTTHCFTYVKIAE